MSSKVKLKIGTSGWHYNDWQGRFYPEDLKKKDWLKYFSKEFDTVEINNTFYQLPKLETVKNWYKTVEDNFEFTVKASRYITHIKKLKDPEQTLQKFFDIIEPLKEKLGTILYQLPPNQKIDLEKMEHFLQNIPRKNRSVFEFRNDSWYEDSLYELLSKYNCGFCIHDMPENSSPRIITSDILYVRFHGPSGKYRGDYPDKLMKDWAEWIAGKSSSSNEIYCYFNNDLKGFAVKNAKTLRNFIKEML